MNKTELISAVAQTAEMTKKDSEKAVKAVIDVISQALVKGDKVQLIGFRSVHSKSASAKPVKATTRRPRKLLRFRLPRARLGEFPNS